MITVSKLTFSPQNINLEIPVSKTTAPRNIKQPYMIILLKKKKNETTQNRIKITKRIPGKLKPQLKFRIGTVLDR